MKKNLCRALLVSFILIFNSCIGISMDIQMNKDGSGRVVIEYRYSTMLENLGTFDGNESMPALPASAEDWKKTIEKISGLKLVSYSSKTVKSDIISSATLDFENEKALLSLLDPTGKQASIERKDNHGNLKINIFDKHSELFDEEIFDERTLALAALFLNDYDLSISFTTAGNSTLSIINAKGESLSAPASSDTELSGKKVLFTMGMSDIFNYKEGLGLIFNW